MRRHRNIKRKILKISIVVVLVLLFGYFKYNSSIYTPIDDTDTTKISIQIKKGESVKEIAQTLNDKELIRSKTSFYLYVKKHSLGEKIIAGRFILNKSMNVPEILENLQNINSAQYVITIQEGLRIVDIEEKLIDLNLIKEGEFTKAVKEFKGWQYYTFLNKETLSKLELPLEGYIYPDTYFLDPQDFKADDLIYLALDNFEKKWLEISKNKGGELKNYTVSEVVTMASIIENEVFGNKNREIVSGILWKRLENEWAIGADATLLYITPDRKITKSDLEIDSPYNTRKFKGLPPGPISNPSVESLNAAIHPQDSEYWFYLTTLDTGEVIYAKSNEEHNENKREHL